jgi:hypothetical protein
MQEPLGDIFPVSFQVASAFFCCPATRCVPRACHEEWVGSAGSVLFRTEGGVYRQSKRKRVQAGLLFRPRGLGFFTRYPTLSFRNKRERGPHGPFHLEQGAGSTGRAHASGFRRDCSFDRGASGSSRVTRHSHFETRGGGVRTVRSIWNRRRGLPAEQTQAGSGGIPLSTAGPRVLHALPNTLIPNQQGAGSAGSVPFGTGGGVHRQSKRKRVQAASFSRPQGLSFFTRQKTQLFRDSDPRTWPSSVGRSNDLQRDVSER